jgi:hypothetical protein
VHDCIYGRTRAAMPIGSPSRESGKAIPVNLTPEKVSRICDGHISYKL